jgi:hypothetical protein
MMPESVAKSALTYVQILDKPATNWPGIDPQTALKLKGEQTNQKIIASRTAGSWTAYDDVMKKAKEAAIYIPLLPRLIDTDTGRVPEATLEQHLKMGEYFAKENSCTSFNCGERAAIAFWFAYTNKGSVGALQLHTNNHDWVMITTDRNLFHLLDQPTPNIGGKWNLQAGHNGIGVQGAADAWMCDPWYYGNAQNNGQAGVAYPIGNWSQYGPAILAAAGDNIPMNGTLSCYVYYHFPPD